MSFILLAGCTSNIKMTPYARGEWKAHPTVEEEYHDATVVCIGKVKKVENVIDKDGFIDGMFYTVSVGKIFKGNLSHQIKLYSENNSARFPMDIGGEYLIFASKQHFKDIGKSQFTVNACGNSAPLPQAKKIVSEVLKINKK